VYETDDTNGSSFVSNLCENHGHERLFSVFRLNMHRTLRCKGCQKWRDRPCIFCGTCTRRVSSASDWSSPDSCEFQYINNNNLLIWHSPLLSPESSHSCYLIRKRHVLALARIYETMGIPASSCEYVLTLRIRHFLGAPLKYARGEVRGCRDTSQIRMMRRK
jgi:hypothetical protein